MNWVCGTRAEAIALLRSLPPPRPVEWRIRQETDLALYEGGGRHSLASKNRHVREQVGTLL